jgi:hypothetical protein
MFAVCCWRCNRPSPQAPSQTLAGALHVLLPCMACALFRPSRGSCFVGTLSSRLGDAAYLPLSLRQFALQQRISVPKLQPSLTITEVCLFCCVRLETQLPQSAGAQPESG